MEIRKVTKTDTEIIRDLLQNHIDLDESVSKPPSLKHIENLLDDDRTYLFVAITDNLIAGYTLAYRFPSLYATENMAYLYDIDVLEQYKRKGIGKMLMQEVMSALKKDDVNELWLGTAVDNFPAQQLFSKVDGIKTGETFNDFTFYLAEKS